jgi:hypothetical protein
MAKAKDAKPQSSVSRAGLLRLRMVVQSFGAPTGKLLEEIQIFELYRGKKFKSHHCNEHPRAKTQSAE